MFSSDSLCCRPAVLQLWPLQWHLPCRSNKSTNIFVLVYQKLSFCCWRVGARSLMGKSSLWRLWQKKPTRLWYWFLPFIISQYYQHICNVYFSMQGWFIHTWNFESSIIQKVLQWWNVLIGPLTVRIIKIELKSYLFCSDVPPAVSAPILPLCWHLNTK